MKNFSDKSNQNRNEFVRNFRMNKGICVENLDLKDFNYIKNIMNVKNNLFYCKKAAVFNSSNLAQTSMSYAERCFLMVAKTNSFLELDFSFVKKFFNLPNFILLQSWKYFMQ